MLNPLKGEYSVVKTIEDLKRFAVPKAGDFSGRVGTYWQGIQHGTLMETVMQVLAEFGLAPYNDPCYAVSPNGAGLIATIDLGKYRLKKDGKPGKTIDPLYCSGFESDNTGPKVLQSMGVVHSNDSRKALTMVAGGRVLICSNGMVTGEQVARRKHTHRLTLVDWIREEFSDLLEKLGESGRLASALRDFAISDPEHESLLLEVARRDLIPWRLLGNLDRCWLKARKETPELLWVDHEKYTDDDWQFNATAWDWYNAATHVAKELPPRPQLKALDGVFKVCQELLPPSMRDGK